MLTLMTTTTIGRAPTNFTLFATETLKQRQRQRQRQRQQQQLLLLVYFDTRRTWGKNLRKEREKKKKKRRPLRFCLGFTLIRYIFARALDHTSGSWILTPNRLPCSTHSCRLSEWERNATRPSGLLRVLRRGVKERCKRSRSAPSAFRFHKYLLLPVGSSSGSGNHIVNVLPKTKHVNNSNYIIINLLDRIYDIDKILYETHHITYLM